MSVTSSAQVPDGAVDTLGVSVLTAARDVDVPRAGSLYDTVSLAAVQPIHCHPLTENKYLMVFSRRWYEATPDTADPGAYTAYSEDTTPGWVTLNVPSGHRSIVGGGYPIHLDTTATDVILTAACSRATEYLYLLDSATVDGSTVGIVSHWWINSSTGAVMEMAEEVVPSSGDIVFDRGLWYRPPYLIVFGADAENQVHMARKPWSRIGTNRVNVKSTDGSLDNTGPELRWQFFDGSGWDIDSTALSPLVAADGSVITTRGPISTVSHRGRTFMATVAAAGAVRSAVVWTNRGDQGWRPTGDEVPLGSTADDSYLGGTLQFQQQLAPMATAAEMIDPVNMAAFPYVTSIMSEDSGAFRLENTWGLWAVPR